MIGPITAREYIMKLLSENKSKDFVNRILEQSMSPMLPEGDGSGRMKTHHMAWNGDQGGPFNVYPEVMRDGPTLKDYAVKSDGTIDRGAAWDEAYRRGEYMQFLTPELADWVSQNYKLAWDQNPYWK